jgi:hypothetical protein
MKTIVRDSALLIDVAAIAAGYRLAQEPFLEKHVKDIRAEPTEDVIFASPLCRQANAARYHIIDQRVNPATAGSGSIRAYREQ